MDSRTILHLVTSPSEAYWHRRARHRDSRRRRDTRTGAYFRVSVESSLGHHRGGMGCGERCVRAAHISAHRTGDGRVDGASRPAVVTEVTLRVGENAMVRCRSYMDIPASEMFGAPAAGGLRSFEKFRSQSPAAWRQSGPVHR